VKTQYYGLLCIAVRLPLFQNILHQFSGSSYPSSTFVKNERSCTSTPSIYTFMVHGWTNLPFNSIFRDGTEMLLIPFLTFMSYPRTPQYLYFGYLYEAITRFKDNIYYSDSPARYRAQQWASSVHCEM